jgi:hypothetical protein
VIVVNCSLKHVFGSEKVQEPPMPLTSEEDRKNGINLNRCIGCSSENCTGCNRKSPPKLKVNISDLVPGNTIVLTVADKVVGVIEVTDE